MLIRRGYHPIEFTSALYRPLVPQPDSPPAIHPRLQNPSDDLWRRGALVADLHPWMVFRSGLDRWHGEPWPSYFPQRRVSCFFAEWEGQPIATGVLRCDGGVALFAGASTIPEGRRRGAQRALLDARIRTALENGCDLAMMCTAPGSTSQHNAEREGFRIAYTRIKWQRAR